MIKGGEKLEESPDLGYTHLMLTQAQIQSLVSTLQQQYQPEEIVLFGSYAWGVPQETSDLDFLIVKKTDLPSYKRSAEVAKIISHQRQQDKILTGVSIDFVIKTPEEIQQRLALGDPFIEDMYLKGKKVYVKAKA